MSKFSLPVVFIKPIFKADRSVKLEFETRELNGDEIAILADHRQTEGWMVYSSDNDIKEADIPDEKPDAMVGTKTQAQRLRGSMYKAWETNGKKGEFDNFYRTQMERLIELYKEKINE